MNALESLRRFWESTSPQKRLNILVMASIFGVTATLIFFWASRPDYKPLYTNLSSKDAAAIAKKLQEEKIPYVLRDEGTTILVPQRALYETRLRMAGYGLPESGNVGFELIDRMNFQTSEFIESVNYNRALQGELAKTIMSIEEIRAARVLLNVPKESMFMEDAAPPSASVVVSLAGGRRLSPGQVQSIAYLVSSSVKNMKPEYVTIVDEKGTLLYSPEFAEGGAGPGNLQMKLSFQRELETRVQGMLDNVFGMGKAVVKVAVEFEQDRRTIETEMFEPPDRNLGNLRSMQEKSEGYGESGETKAAIAVPGGPSGTQSYSNKNIIKNYELNRRKEQRVVASDKIKRITAGVFLDSSVRLDETGRKDILKVLETSIGINRARGDTITICPLAFNNDYWKEQKSAMKEEEQRQRIFTLIRLASPAFAVLVFIAFYLILLRNMRKMKASLPARGGRETPLMLKEGLAPLSAFSRPGGEFPDLQRSGLMPPHMAVSEEERIRRLALEDPDRIAKVLETLLVEAEKEKDHAAAH